MTITRATAEDTATIAGQRRAMFVDMGYRDEALLDGMCSDFREWVRPRLVSGEYLAWLVTDNGVAVSGLGLWLMDWPPHVIGPGSPRGNILNVYTLPESRRRGMARALMNVALEWCRANRIASVILHASPEGKTLYEAFGFKPTNEMRLLLEA
jgi:GNAT superfamily N-acetyltransferase